APRAEIVVPAAPKVEIVQAPAPALPPPPPVEVQPKVVAPPPPPAPQMPVGPKVGDKVGFIQLPQKAAAKPPEKPAPGKLPLRPAQPRTTDFTKRGDIRAVRGGTVAPAGPAVPGARLPSQKAAAPSKPAEPAAPAPPRITLPADAQVISIKPPIVV